MNNNMVETDDEIVARAIAIMRRRHRKGRAMKSPREVKEYLILTENTRGVEEFRALWLDNQHRIIATETLSTGSLTQASVYPREVVRAALAHNAAAVIVTHNHPSGTLEPSEQDKALTRHLKSSLGLVDVRLLDHIITAHGEAMSFADEGIL